MEDYVTRQIVSELRELNENMKELIEVLREKER